MAGASLLLSSIGSTTGSVYCQQHRETDIAILTFRTDTYKVTNWAEKL